MQNLPQIIPRIDLHKFNLLFGYWEKKTKFVVEENVYSKFVIANFHSKFSEINRTKYIVNRAIISSQVII